MPTKIFEAKLEKPDTIGAWTYFVLPFDAESEFQAKGHIKVKGTINGVEFRSSISPRGNGKHYMIVNKKIQRAANVSRNDVIEVIMTTDNEPRRIEVPEKVMGLVNSKEEYKEIFKNLSYSKKKDFATMINSAKKESTKDKRLLKIEEELIRKGKKMNLL